jgi:hypothetical protein
LDIRIFQEEKMKFKLLILLSLAAFLLLSGCRGGSNTNAVINTNTNVTNVANRATPVTQTNESAATDPALKGKVEAALKAKGFTDVTVDTSGPTMTLRGSYPKDKLPELMQTAIEANGGKPVQNQATGK